jgi:RNA-directed DNA polymerase
MDATDKPFMIEKRRVYEAYKAVRSSKGGAGLDGQTIEAFEAEPKGNLYKIWNGMSSGSYFCRRYALSPFPRRMVANGSWVCPPWRQDRADGRRVAHRAGP